MNNEFYDPIVAEVRKNREEMLAEFGGDTKKLTEYLESKRPEMEAAGLRFETAEGRQARLAWKKKQNDELAQKLAAL